MKRDGGPRTIRSTVRWSEAEWQRLVFLAGRSGLKPSSYIRAAALVGVPPPPRAPRTGRTRFEEPRSVRKLIRFHPREWRRIERLARTLRMPPIRFVREAAVGYRISTRLDDEAIRQLARVGNNLNQLARVANVVGQVKHAAALRRVLESIQGALDRLL